MVPTLNYERVLFEERVSKWWPSIMTGSIWIGWFVYKVWFRPWRGWDNVALVLAPLASTVAILVWRGWFRVVVTTSALRFGSFVVRRVDVGKVVGFRLFGKNVQANQSTEEWPEGREEWVPFFRFGKVKGVRTDQGVEVMLLSGEVVRIGTERGEELIQALREMRDSRTGE